MPTISLPTYSVTVEAGALARLGEIARGAAAVHRWVVITDETVRGLYSTRVAAALGPRVDVLAIPPGESEKTRARWAALTDSMLAAGCGRDTGVVALGGGVIGDLAGFVAQADIAREARDEKRVEDTVEKISRPSGKHRQ